MFQFIVNFVFWLLVVGGLAVAAQSIYRLCRGVRTARVVYTLVGAVLAVTLPLLINVIVGICSAFYYHPIWSTLAAIIVFFVARRLVRLVVRVLGHYGIRIAKVSADEGYETSLEAFGDCVVSVINYDNYDFQPGPGVDKNIVESKGTNRPRFAGSHWLTLPIGGWVYYLAPFVQPIPYAKTNDDDGFGDNVSVRLGQLQQSGLINNARTEPNENIVLPQVGYILLLQVVNAYRFRFRSRRGVIKEIMEVFEVIMREIVANHKEADLRQVRGQGNVIWGWLTPEHLQKIKAIAADWGVRVIPKSLLIKHVAVDETISRAMQAKVMAGHLADAEAIRLGGPAKRMFEEWLAAQVSHLPEADRKARIAEIRASDEGKAKEKEFDDLRRDALAADAGGLTRVSANGELGGAVALFKAAGFAKKNN